MWPSHIATFSWMPWVVLAVERAWCEGGSKIPLAAFAGAMQMLAGGPETIFLTWLILSALWLQQFIKAETPRAVMLLRFPMVVVLIFALSAAQLLPFLDLVAHAQRESGYSRFALVHARLRPRQFSSADGLWFDCDGRNILPIWPILDVIVLPWHWNFVARLDDGLLHPPTSYRTALNDCHHCPALRSWREYAVLPARAKVDSAIELHHLPGEICHGSCFCSTIAGGACIGQLFPRFRRRKGTDKSVCQKMFRSGLWQLAQCCWFLLVESLSGLNTHPRPAAKRTRL